MKRAAAHGAGAQAALLALLAGLGTGPTQAADPGRGAGLYRSHCAGCHGETGRPVLPGAPDFARPTALLKPDLSLLATIRAGRGGMPGYAGQLRDREILDLVAHLRTLR
jgi:cytochrome c6